MKNPSEVFKVEDVFIHTIGKSTNIQDIEDLTNSKKLVPLVTRKIGNNGIDSFYSINAMYNGNVLTISTQGATAYYQEKLFITGTGVHILSHEKLNRFNSLFLISTINKITKIYGFGYELSSKRLLASNIKLPVVSDGEIDWYYMEAEGKRAEEEALKRSPLYRKLKDIKMDKKVKKEIKMDKKVKKFKVEDSEIDLKKIALSLNNYMYSAMNLSINFRPPFISSAIIALMDRDFKSEDFSAYRTSTELMNRLLQSVENTLKNNLNFTDNEILNIRNTYGFKGEKCFNALIDKKDPLSDPLINILTALKDNVMSIYNSNQNLDVIGIFYTEFLRYANGDKGELGIVLTPKHIAELMTNLLNLNINDKVIDTCTGSGGFLLPVINKLKVFVGNDAEAIKNIEENSIMASELQNKMYSLLISNLAIRKIHTKNIKYGDCFNLEEAYKVFNANKAIVNPPYSMAKKGGKYELEFIEFALDVLSKGGSGVFIVPKSVMFKMDSKTNVIRERIFKKHRLDGVFSMNNELFYPTSASTVICVFTAHEPHLGADGLAKAKTYLANWSNDGFEIRKGLGRVNVKKTFTVDSENWIKDYMEKNENDGYSIYKKIELMDEWLYEAHGMIDYSDFCFEDIVDSARALLAFEMGEKR